MTSFFILTRGSQFFEDKDLPDVRFQEHREETDLLLQELEDLHRQVLSSDLPKSDRSPGRPVIIYLV